jgi:outer membrane translocation and assembly module TamA
MPAPCWQAHATAFPPRCCSAPEATRPCAATHSKAWVASGEVTHWLNDNLGIATFVDAGNAVDSPRDLAHLALGYGVGGRLRTPIGPFRLDLAYGQDVHQVRVHFSVGLAF